MTSFGTHSVAEVNGLRMCYRDWGGSGQPMVLVHGLASNRHIWDLVAPILAQDFHVFAVDQRGHGESDKPDSGYDFETVAGDLNGFVTALGTEAPILVGHSWGGDVALEHAIAYPDETRGLCLVDGGTIEISNYFPTLEAAKKEMAPPDFTGLTLADLQARGEDMDFGFEITPQIREMMLANFEVLNDDTVRARLSRQNHMAVIEAFWDHKPSELYRRVACPALLMPTRGERGFRPKLWSERAERSIADAGKALPVSKTVWIDDSVHDVPLQRPELVARIIADHVRDGFFG